MYIYNVESTEDKEKNIALDIVPKPLTGSVHI